ncbi:hypothetical protein QT972_00035 [Microcoleus sp. herbarium7]|uniref:hypothetical protein n=1 Tax=Microcoleus sp. herbarium7 TaxID=3055435 RepID=UPI002FD2579D
MFNLNSELSEYKIEDFAVPDRILEQEQQKTQLLAQIQQEFERLGLNREFQEMLSYQTTGRDAGTCRQPLPALQLTANVASNACVLRSNKSVATAFFAPANTI